MAAESVVYQAIIKDQAHPQCIVPLDRPHWSLQDGPRLLHSERRRCLAGRLFPSFRSTHRTLHSASSRVPSQGVFPMAEKLRMDLLCRLSIMLWVLRSGKTRASRLRCLRLRTLAALGLAVASRPPRQATRRSRGHRALRRYHLHTRNGRSMTAILT